MNSSATRLNANLEVALQRMRTAAELASERSVEALGLSALTANSNRRRDALLAAQFVFRQNRDRFASTFNQVLRDSAQVKSQTAAERNQSATQNWQDLSLVDDDEVEALVSSDRIGLAIEHECEWELREVESYISTIMPNHSVDSDTHPLRPEVIGKALLSGVHAVSDDADTQQILVDELTRALSKDMRNCYADISQAFRVRGLQPAALSVRTQHAPLGLSGTSDSIWSHSTITGKDSGGSELSQHQSGYGHSTAGGSSSGGHSSYQDSRGNSASGGGRGSTFMSRHDGASEWRGIGQGHTASSGRMMGQVDQQMMGLMRRLAQMPIQPNVPNDPSGMPDGPLDWTQSAHGNTTIAAEYFPLPGMMAANVIHAHREELRQASSGALDHLVIDVVASLFDQVLSDPKVPPQMARILARLQLPVLRTALGDPSFFASRKHPVRRVINRMASLACAFDDFDSEPGHSFLERVKALVQDIAEGDFDQVDLYEAKLDALEVLALAQSNAALQSDGDPGALLAVKESEMRIQQRYVRQLKDTLASVVLPDFLRDFITQIWGQAIALAVQRDGPNAERTLRLRKIAVELVMSLQPKGAPAQRKVFLQSLPKLMKGLNEGMDLVGWADQPRRDFFGHLLPAHADSLKGQSLSALDQNLLAKQVEGIFNAKLPKDEGKLSQEPVSATGTLDIVAQFTAAEMQSLGLVDEPQIDWTQAVDIDLSAEAPPSEVDVSIDGLPSISEPLEPVQGAALAEHLQLGFAYQMHLEGGWQKVRLSHISSGRAFFIFTRGQQHTQTLTMTSRMLTRMCEAGRLRAYESAHLLERATARARKQLAALNATGAKAH